MSRFKSNISNEELALLDKCLFEGDIRIIDSEDQCLSACEYLASQSIVGFDTETRPSFKAGRSNPVALLQIASAERCYLFRLSRMKLCREIARILADESIMKVGVAVRDDIKGLQKLRWFRAGNFVDLQTVAPQWGIAEKSLRKLSGIVLQRSVSKAQRLSNWEAANLTSAQIKYAATDAWVCLEIYNELLKEIP